MTTRSNWTAALALTALAACTPEAPDRWTERGPTAEKLDCNPIAADWDCMYPFPSDFFVAPDDSLPGGRRVDMTEASLPKNHNLPDRPPINFFDVHPADGFSILPQISARIPGGVDTDALVFHTGDVGVSLTKSSPTVLLDAESGEFQLHFAEMDVRPETVDDRALVLRPMKALKYARRYVVAFHGLKHPDGSAIEPPAAFRRLRDGKPSGDLEKRLAAYYDAHVFPALEKAGISRGSLTLAWDFTTQTQENASGDLLAVRADVIRTFEAEPPKVTISGVTDIEKTTSTGLSSTYIGREIRGEIEVPLYLEEDAPGSLLHRDDNGRVTPRGTTKANFLVRIPHSVLEGDEPGRLVQYGHGFFGGRDEVQGHYVSRFAGMTNSVIIATDWAGMATIDAVQVIGDLSSDASLGMRFTDRIHQGMANFIALNYAARHVMKDLEEFRKDGRPYYDPEHLYYYGISQGHILGTTYVALAPAIERAAFSVGGASFGFMMSRSRNFLPFLQVIDNASGSKAASHKVVQLLQTSMDRIDPVTYSPHLLENTYEGSPARRHLLMQIGIGDAQVPNMAAHMQARTMNLKHLQPAPRAIYGLEKTEGPVDSAIVEFDFGIEPPDVFATQVTDDNPAHEGVRRRLPAIQQIDAFLRPDGEIRNFCDGACVCDEAANECSWQ